MKNSLDARKKAREVAKKARKKDDKSKQSVVRAMNAQIEKSKPGSSEEKELVYRRNKLMKSMGMRPMKVGK